LALAVPVLCAQVASATEGILTPDLIGRILAESYPQSVSAATEGAVRVAGKHVVQIPPADPSRSRPEVLDHAGVADMFLDRYPLGTLPGAPRRGHDPGRVRAKAFFDLMYGDCAKGEVEQNLVEVVWLPRKSGERVRVTRINGVAEKLSAVSRELDALPSRFDVFLKPSAGGYVCRSVAGSERASAHGWGIAIDVAVKGAHYWRWSSRIPPAEGSVFPYRNAIPGEIVEIFERHGFIWGGKWYHYDTMHFEYRPELIAAAAHSR
jgi:hypothetical protein